MTLPHPPHHLPESYQLEISRDAFFEHTDRENQGKMTAAINAARSVGIFICADLLSLGKDQMNEVVVHRRVPKAALKLFYGTVETLIECEIPQARVPQTEWPKLYEDILDASIANLLPAHGPDYNFPTYRTLDFGQGSTTIGTFLQPRFEEFAVSSVQAHASHMLRSPSAQLRQITELSAHIDGLISFREEVVIPAVRQFIGQDQDPFGSSL